MKTLKESSLTEGTIESIEDVAKLLKPYVKQWYKSIPVNNEYSDDLVPVRNIADGIIKYGSSYNEGIWKSLNFELKSDTLDEFVSNFLMVCVQKYHL